MLEASLKPEVVSTMAKEASRDRHLRIRGSLVLGLPSSQTLTGPSRIDALDTFVAWCSLLFDGTTEAVHGEIVARRSREEGQRPFLLHTRDDTYARPTPHRLHPTQNALTTPRNRIARSIRQFVEDNFQPIRLPRHQSQALTNSAVAAGGLFVTCGCAHSHPVRTTCVSHR